MFRIAYFITPHGFGHAARANAVMEALLTLQPDVYFEVFTTIPVWFFEQNLAGHFTYHPTITDVGLVQSDPLHEDLSLTLQRLSEFLPIRDKDLLATVNVLDKTQCKLAFCDVSAFGLKAAQMAGIPSVLIENFTWDWIYAAYQEQVPRFNFFIDLMAKLYESATYHIKTIPFCDPFTPANLLANPVSRRSRSSPNEIRRRLGITEQSLFVLLSFGGVEPGADFFSDLSPEQYRAVYVIPGFTNPEVSSENLKIIPHHHNYYHPDLVSACDLLICKAGYSTVAEAYYAGIPLGFISRPGFRETRPLVEFIQSQIPSFSISSEDFRSGKWQKAIPQLTSLPRMNHPEINGAVQIANFIGPLLGA